MIWFNKGGYKGRGGDPLPSEFRGKQTLYPPLQLIKLKILYPKPLRYSKKAKVECELRLFDKDFLINKMHFSLLKKISSLSKNYILFTANSTLIIFNDLLNITYYVLK